jgi:hypothetical protein
VPEPTADVAEVAETPAAPAVTQVEDIAMDDGVGSHMADVQQIVRPSANGRDLSAVTPQRPEPFIPQRAPEHPEPAVAVGGGVAAAPATAHAIERDPSVNKSLLLRLIAGVRGL